MFGSTLRAARIHRLVGIDGETEFRAQEMVDIASTMQDMENLDSISTDPPNKVK